MKWWGLHVAGPPQPRSFLLELLVLICVETKEVEGMRISSAYGLFLQSLEVVSNWNKLIATWSWQKKSWQPFHAKRAPLILDPCNPTNNVARTLNRRGWKALAKAAEDTARMLTGGHFRNLEPSLARASKR